MRLDDRTAYTIILAERGLEIESFDGYVLKLSYEPAEDAEAEAGRAVRISDLAQYAARMLSQLPDACLMFPGLDHIQVVIAQSVTSRRPGPRSSTEASQSGSQSPS
jgi:hypothetical protein